MKNEGLSIFLDRCNFFFTLTAKCKGCDLIPRIGLLSETGLCVSCVDKRICAKCTRYLGPHLYAGDEARCNACIRKATQQGGARIYKSLGGAVIEKILTEDDENERTFKSTSTDTTTRSDLSSPMLWRSSCKFNNFFLYWNYTLFIICCFKLKSNFL